MELDKILIGKRIRAIREDFFEETRSIFANRCNLTETHVGQIERGEIMPSVKTFAKISKSTDISVDYILFGTGEENNLQIAQKLHTMIDRSTPQDIALYYKIIKDIQSHNELYH